MKLDDPDAKIKFIAAESLYLVGGLIFDAHRNRFANELGKTEPCDWRDVEEQTSVPSRASDEIDWHCECYSGRGVLEALRVWCNICREYGSHRLKDAGFERSPHSGFLENGPGSCPAYPSGKSWDKASGKTGSGKKFYYNVISGADFAAQPYMSGVSTTSRGTKLDHGVPTFGCGIESSTDCWKVKNSLWRQQ